MLNIWLFLALSCMCVNWAAVWRGWKNANAISKPAIILALLGWFFSTAGFSFPLLWFGIGLTFALIGDSLLILPGKGFLFGTAAFILTQAAYTIGFNQTQPLITPALAALIVISFALWIWLYSALRRKALPNPAYRKLEMPLIAYNIVILLMVISALSTNLRADWPRSASVLASCGALLFFFSDVMLAVDRFIRPLPTARLWKRVTYQIGQLAIIAGVLLTFSA